MSNPATDSEQIFIENSFGTVTSKRVIYFRDKGWFSGGSREDIPLQHVTSVRLETSRRLVWGILLLLIGVSGLNGNGTAIVGIVFVLFGVILLWGSPSVIVNTAGRDLNAAKGWPWKRNEANSFVEELRKQLFKS